MAKPKDLTNQRFGKLTATKYLGSVPTSFGTTTSLWLCKCDCGEEAEVTTRSLIADRRRTCGCGVVTADPELGMYSGVYREYKRSAKRRGYGLGLTKEQFKNLVTSNCFYCGSEPRLRTADRRQKIKSNGIDRLDSSLDYSISNCVPCCTTCNVAKASLSLSEFLKWINQIYLNTRQLHTSNELQPLAGNQSSDLSNGRAV